MYTAKMELTRNTRDNHPLKKIFTDRPLRVLFLDMPEVDRLFMFYGTAGKGWVTTKVIKTLEGGDEVIFDTLNSSYKLTEITEIEDEDFDYMDYLGTRMSDDS
jgi:hypothetical protein